MRGDGVNEGYHIHDIAMHEVFSTINSFSPSQYYTDCDCGWGGNRCNTYSAAEFEAGSHLMKSGLPGCLTCFRAVIYNSILGFCHWSVEHQHGIPHHLDESEHKVTIDW